MYFKLNLFNMRDLEIMDAMARIPANVTILDLSHSDFGSKSDAELAYMVATIPKNVTSLILRHNDLVHNTGAELARMGAKIAKSVTSIDLSHNKLGSKTGAELARMVAAIPPHIKTINLENNGLFINKSAVERDKIFKALGNDRQRFILTNNGESDLARALAPMVVLKSDKKLPNDVAAHILSFIPSDSNKQRSHASYIEQPKTTEAKIERARIRKAANLAINNYLSWSRGENNLRGPNGFFTWLRHGQAGRNRAEKLKSDINLSSNDPTSMINEFLNHPKTRYHRHSLASFLLDELSKVNSSPWENIDRFPSYKR